MDIRKKFGKRVGIFRLEKGLSQEELVFEGDFNKTSISDVEQGMRNTSIVVVERIANALVRTIGDLLD